MFTRTAAVIRLKRTLAHGSSPVLANRAASHRLPDLSSYSTSLVHWVGRAPACATGLVAHRTAGTKPVLAAVVDTTTLRTLSCPVKLAARAPVTWLPHCVRHAVALVAAVTLTVTNCR